ncbi:MAG: right-handed parallel beta-helix repeat-containing protein [Planctomycetota bacterium]|jgi:hypothetical protein
MRASSIFFFLGLFSVAGFSAVIHVPADYPTIQQAIDAAVHGDTVLVAPDTYVENINFLGKAISVKSEKGAELTVIDGGQADSVVTFDHMEGIQSVLDGFLITNGDASYGGGINCRYGSSPTIKHNLIDDNSAIYVCGISCEFSAAIIANNVLSWNFAEQYGTDITANPRSPTTSSSATRRKEEAPST